MWIKEFHIKPETLKLIEEKVGKSLEDMGTGEGFLNSTAMACAVRSRMTNGTSSNCKASVRQRTLSINPKFDRGIISNIYIYIYIYSIRTEIMRSPKKMQAKKKKKQKQNTKNKNL
jgi:hypothetical protein